MKEPIEFRFNELLREHTALKGAYQIAQKTANEQLEKTQKSANRYLLLLLFLPLFTLLCHKIPPPSVSRIEYSNTRDSLETLRFLHQKMGMTAKNQVKYVVKQGDMLVTIGELFFNNREAGYQIGIDNNIISDYDQKHLVVGDTLIINFR